MRFHHVQVACPPGGEDVARRFYAAGRAGDLHVVQPHETSSRSGLCATTKMRRNGRLTRPAASAG